MRLILLSTSGCHLCELAQQLMQQYCVDCEPINIEIIDIAEHNDWQPQYALRIPVLFDSNTKADLSWPFTLADVRTFIERIRHD